MEERDIASASVPDALAALHVNPETGLTQVEVDARRKEHGYNEVAESCQHEWDRIKVCPLAPTQRQCWQPGRGCQNALRWVRWPVENWNWGLKEIWLTAWQHGHKVGT